MAIGDFNLSGNAQISQGASPGFGTTPSELRAANNAALLSRIDPQTALALLLGRGQASGFLTTTLGPAADDTKRRQTANLANIFERQKRASELGFERAKRELATIPRPKGPSGKRVGIIDLDPSKKIEQERRNQTLQELTEALTRGQVESQSLANQAARFNLKQQREGVGFGQDVRGVILQALSRLVREI